MTGTSFAVAFSLWSIPGAGSSTTIVIRECPSTVVGPTVRLSMLNCRRETRPDTRESTPGSFSTSAEMTAVAVRVSLRPRDRRGFPACCVGPSGASVRPARGLAFLQSLLDHVQMVFVERELAVVTAAWDQREDVLTGVDVRRCVRPSSRGYLYRLLDMS